MKNGLRLDALGSRAVTSAYYWASTPISQPMILSLISSVWGRGLRETLSQGLGSVWNPSLLVNGPSGPTYRSLLEHSHWTQMTPGSLEPLTFHSLVAF